MLRERLSREQLASKLRSMNSPSLRDAYVCRETIYNAIYALPVGELRKELSWREPWIELGRKLCSCTALSVTTLTFYIDFTETTSTYRYFFLATLTASCSARSVLRVSAS